MGEDVGVPELAMRVGIVTGEVAVTIGAEHQGMVAGDAVNTASRVQSVADPGQVWVDETTRLLTSSAITYLDVGSHPLKGKADPVPAVVGPAPWSPPSAAPSAPTGSRRRWSDATASCGWSRSCSTRVEESRQPGPAGDGGRARRRQVAAGLGVREVRRRPDDRPCAGTAAAAWPTARALAFFALAEAIRPRLQAARSRRRADGRRAEDQGRLLELGLETLRRGPAGSGSGCGPGLGALLGIGSVGTFPREDLFSAWTVFLERVGGDRTRSCC